MQQPAHNPTSNAVFLNIPYDQKFRRLYLAYIVGLVYLGLEPRVTLGLPGGARRLDKMIELIAECRYSIHDLSRVEIDRNPPFPTPRFNMPFELGLAVAYEKQAPDKHTWFVFESKDRRLKKSLSDVDGSDPNIHDGHVIGVLRELNNAFVRPGYQPTMPEMLRAYRRVSKLIGHILEDTGAKGLFEAGVFRNLCYAAKLAVE